MDDKLTNGGNTQVSAAEPVKHKRGRPKGAKDKAPRSPARNAGPDYRFATPEEKIKVVEERHPDPVQIVLDNMDDNDAEGHGKPYTMQEIQPTGRKRMNIADRKNNEFGADRTEPGDNSKYIRYALMSLELPPIDITNPDQVRDRLLEYFSFCEEHDRKPSAVGMANWLGVHKTTLDNWKRGDLRSDTHAPIIQRAYALLEEMSVDYFQNGKVNPAAGIFLLKNMFQYKDVQDVVVTPNNPIGDATQQKQLEDKYLDIVDAPEEE